MMEKSQIRRVLADQRERFERPQRIVLRDVPQSILSTKKIIVITGIRRCGKSTLLKQLATSFAGYHYINFEDERLLDFTAADFQVLLEAFMEQNPRAKTFFFDEIQNIPGWEKFVRRVFSDAHKVVVTGSNARLLSSEIATSLTGRNVHLQLFPFSFLEYLRFFDVPVKGVMTTRERAALSSHLREYIALGGFPEIILSKDKEELAQIYRDILVKDLLVRFKIRDAKDFRELSLYLLSNVAQKMSYNNLKSMLGFSNTSKVKKYVDFLTEAYLFYSVPKYDYAVRKQIMNDRKVFAADTGIINAVAFSSSENKGWVLENAVFLELLRRREDIYYYQDGKECDFLLRKGNRITAAIQVAATMSHPETRRREVEGLLSAMEKYKLMHGTIIVADGGETFIKDKRIIKAIPLIQFLLARDEMP